MARVCPVKRDEHDRAVRPDRPDGKPVDLIDQIDVFQSEGIAFLTAVSKHVNLTHRHHRSRPALRGRERSRPITVD